MRLIDAEVGRTYMISKVLEKGNGDNLKYLLYTHGLLPGMSVRVKDVKASKNAILVEVVSMFRLLALSKELASLIEVREEVREAE